MRLQPNGRLVGRVRRLHPQSGRPIHINRTSVFMIRDDRVVGDAVIDELGMFVFDQLSPGVFSLAAVGAEGFAAFSVYVLAMENSVSMVDYEGLVPAAFWQAPEQLELDIAMIDPRDFAALRQIVADQLPGGLNPANGNQPIALPPVTSSGGGGFSGGGGGGADLGLLTGAAAGITVLVDRTDEKRPASPFRP